MKSSTRIVVAAFFVLGFSAWLLVATDYGDSAATGTYRFSGNGETSDLVLKSDHTFRQDLHRGAEAQHAKGSWRIVGQGGISFSKEMLMVSGQQRGPDDEGFADISKALGLFTSLKLRQYRILWYGRKDATVPGPLPGTYVGDEDGTLATLALSSDHRFSQDVTHNGVVRHADGTWDVNQSGVVIFSHTFLKISGEPLDSTESATAMDPKGGPLQIEISMSSKSGLPTYWKKPFSF